MSTQTAVKYMDDKLKIMLLMKFTGAIIGEQGLL